MGGRAWTAAAFLIWSASAGAHELGTVQVDAAFLKDGTYLIRALVDMEAVKLGLGPATDLESRFHPRQPVAASVAERFGILVRDYVSQTVLAFDWVQAPLQLDAVVIAPKTNPPPGDTKDYLTIRFTGAIPPGATKFVWSNSMKLGTYLLVMHQEGDEDVSRQFLEARQESNPFRLNPDIAPPTAWALWLRRLPYVGGGLLGLGALAGLALRRRRA